MRDGATLDVIQVMKILPHRPPFLMVDRVTKIEGNRIVAQKNVTMAEPVFEGHFPGHPILPGVLQLEAMAQVAGILMMGYPYLTPTMLSMAGVGAAICVALWYLVRSGY